ncbi:hypothetical protein M0Q50_00965 [bacterium]|jgi:hypothetical protein|nr:hypothetical protein [bacterium]
MKNIKTFENFSDNRKVYSLDELHKMEKWIEEFWEKLGNYEQSAIGSIFADIQNEFGEDVEEIIDHMYSANKLYYHQNGLTVSTGGIDTYDFIENFENIKSFVDDLLN